MEDELDNKGYVRAKFEEITAALCELKNLPALVIGMKTTIDEMVTQVKAHAITLYGKESETGLVGRVERIEWRVNIMIAIGIGVLTLIGVPLLLSVVGGILWLLWNLLVHGLSLLP